MVSLLSVCVLAVNLSSWIDRNRCESSMLAVFLKLLTNLVIFLLYLLSGWPELYILVELNVVSVVTLYTLLNICLSLLLDSEIINAAIVHILDPSPSPYTHPSLHHVHLPFTSDQVTSTFKHHLSTSYVGVGVKICTSSHEEVESKVTYMAYLYLSPTPLHDLHDDSNHLTYLAEVGPGTALSCMETSRLIENLLFFFPLLLG